jgi:hypothetical protein
MVHPKNTYVKYAVITESPQGVTGIHLFNKLGRRSSQHMYLNFVLQVTYLKNLKVNDAFEIRIRQNEITLTE